MYNTISSFLHDDSGFIISAELVLVATVLVLGMLVGLSQVQNAVVSELNDVAHAIGALNQTYYFSGFHARKWFGYTKSRTTGSAFYDLVDTCDAWGCSIACDGAYPEGGYGGCGFGGYGGYGAGGCDGSGFASGGVESRCSESCSTGTPDSSCAPGSSCAKLIAP